MFADFRALVVFAYVTLLLEGFGCFGFSDFLGVEGVLRTLGKVG